MRTTLTIEDELLDQLREIARRERVPFRTVVERTIRRGLAAGKKPASRGAPFRVETFRSAFRPGVDRRRLNQLSDELEARRSIDRS